MNTSPTSNNSPAKDSTITAVTAGESVPETVNIDDNSSSGMDAAGTPTRTHDEEERRQLEYLQSIREHFGKSKCLNPGSLFNLAAGQMILTHARFQWPYSSDAVKEYVQKLKEPHALPNSEKLSLVYFSEIAFFDETYDETYRKACPGSADKNSVAILLSKKLVFFVPRTNGQPTPVNGRIEDYNVLQSYLKYTDEGRFCLGTCVQLERDEYGKEHLIGKRLPLFEYTGKIILSVKKFDDRIQKEISHVKNLKWWVTNTYSQQNFECYQDNPITKLKGIGKITQQLFHTNDV